MPPKTYECPECGERFVKPGKAALLSLLVPCLGDFYLGHWLMGACELLGLGFVWLLAVSSLLADGIAVLPAVVMMFAIYYGLDVALTYRLASKGVLLERDAWKFQ